MNMTHKQRFLAAISAGLLLAMILGAVCFSARVHTCFQPQRFADRTLIIDAGHGGEDGGTVSVTGTCESGINLEIALKMRDLCGFFGVKTILTRTEDRSVGDDSAKTLAEKKRTDLQNRVKLIESTDQAVLISIHQNYFTQSIYSGAQVFYAPTESSEEWGVQCQELLAAALDPDNTRVSKQISEDIYLMNHISCPALLVECGFLSNPEEAVLLETSEYQTKLAVTMMASYLTFSF